MEQREGIHLEFMDDVCALTFVQAKSYGKYTYSVKGNLKDSRGIEESLCMHVCVNVCVWHERKKARASLNSCMLERGGSGGSS